MEIGLHLLLQDQILHRFAFEHGGIIADLIEDRRGENEESSVDPSSLALWLLLEGRDGGPVDAQSSESSRGLDRRHGHISAVTPVEGDGCRNVDIAYAISVCHAKGILMLEIVSHSPEPSSGTGIISGIDESYTPRLCDALMHLHSVVFHIESDVRHVQEIVREVLLDEISLISATNDEVVDSMLRIHLENVPQDRSTADLDHRLWTHDRFFTKPRPEPSRQYDCFHSHPLVLPSLALRKLEAFSPYLLSVRHWPSNPYSTREGASLCMLTLRLDDISGPFFCF
jgi:hypothetical protein